MRLAPLSFNSDSPLGMFMDVLAFILSMEDLPGMMALVLGWMVHTVPRALKRKASGLPPEHQPIRPVRILVWADQHLRHRVISSS